MRVTIKDLWTGDRFTCDGRLYTLLECVGAGKNAHARAHCASSLKLGEQGFGYIGDSLVTFPLSQRVAFQPPTAP